MICTICFLVVLSDYQNKMYQVKKRKKQTNMSLNNILSQNHYG